MEYSNEYTKEFSDEYFGNVKGLDNLYADGSMPNGYTQKGDFVINAKGQNIGGVTVYNGIGKGSNVFMFKASFTSMEHLYLNMGHEYIHVYFNATGTNGNLVSQERVAYKWNINQAKTWNMDYSHYQNMYNHYLGKEAARYTYALPVGFLDIRPKRPW